MRNFEFGQAVLAGANLLRRRPWAVLGLALVGTLVSFTGRVTAVFSTHFMVAALSRPVSPLVISTTTTFVNLLAFLMVMSVIAGAVLRGGRVKLGGDEGRLFVLSLLAFLALAIVFLAIGVGGAITSIGRLEGGREDGVMFTALALGVILALALASRFSLAGPMTVQDGRLRFMASWRLTREWRWKVCGVFLVTLLMAALIGGLGGFLLIAVITALGLDTSLTFDPSLAVALKAVIRPAGLVHVLFQGLLIGLAVVIQVASLAYIHNRLAGDPVADQAAIFD